MPAVFIVVVSLAAYAVGAVVTRWTLASRRSSAVHPLEVLLATAALAGIVLFRGSPYTVTYCLSCAAAMLLIGGTAAGLTNRCRLVGGTGEFEDAAAQLRGGNPWKRCLNFSRAVVDYEFRLLLVACYLLIIGPMALGFRLLRGEAGNRGSASTWNPKSDTPTLEAARRPF